MSSMVAVIFVIANSATPYARRFRALIETPILLLCLRLFQLLIRYLLRLRYREVLIRSRVISSGLRYWRRHFDIFSADAITILYAIITHYAVTPYVSLPP